MLTSPSNTLPMRANSILILLYLCVQFISCTSTKKQELVSHRDSSFYKPKYATGFTVKKNEAGTLVEITYPYQGATKGYKYLLISDSLKTPMNDKEITIIRVPLKNIVCTSTTHVPLLDYLGLTQKLIGFPTTDYISSFVMRSRIDSGKVVDLGIDKGMNIEQLIALKPSAVMGYTMSNDLGQLKKIQELGMPVIINAEYLEKHPLGRAEWIKFMALFFNKEKEADSVFRFIEKEYLETQQLAEKSIIKPRVMSGIVYGDTWYLPGGKNYASKLLTDAGSNYLWGDNESNGFLELSFESVYQKAHNADVWIGVGSYESLAEIKASEVRYSKFSPFKKGTVFSYNARKGAKGGSEFLELGYLRPDLILKDLVKIVHPELLPEYQLYFYKQLK